MYYFSKTEGRIIIMIVMQYFKSSSIECEIAVPAEWSDSSYALALNVDSESIKPLQTLKLVHGDGASSGGILAL